MLLEYREEIRGALNVSLEPHIILSYKFYIYVIEAQINEPIALKFQILESSPRAEDVITV